MTAHADLTGTSLHENKGVDVAADHYVATAFGAATVWKLLTIDNMDTSSIFNLNKAYLTITLPDVSTASKVWLVVPFAGTLTKVDSALGATITGADSVVTVRDNAGNSAGNFTVAQSGSLPGDVDSLSPVGNNTFTAGQKLSIETDGASTGLAAIHLTLTFTITG